MTVFFANNSKSTFKYSDKTYNNNLKAGMEFN